MATKKNFQVDVPTDEATTPFIFRVEEEDTGLTWGQAKKVLRAWYLNESRKLRKYTEKDFEKQEQVFLESDLKDNKVESVSSPI